MKIQMTVLAIVAAATVVAAPLGTEFTYQGVLSDAGAPATGVFDFRFLLYDADVGGSQVGIIVALEDVTVTDGRFTTQLDFGSVFDGTALWLEVSVRDGGLTGTYTVLSPRQELTAAPFAQHSQTADVAAQAGWAFSADWAQDSNLLNGEHGAYYLAWSNFVGIPADIADGDDDVVGSLSCGDDEIARWTGTAWSCSPDDDTPFIRTLVVGPVGTPAENAIALDQAIGSIFPGPSLAHPVLVKIGPGVYDYGSGTLPLSTGLVMEGAGRDFTRITSARCGMNFYDGTLFSSSSYIGLRNLTVENTCANPASYSIALCSQGNWVTIEGVRLISNGAAQRNYAMFNSGHELNITETTLKAENGTDLNQGLENWGGDVTLVDVTVEVLDGSITRGIENEGGSFTFRQGSISVWGGTSDCTGFFNDVDADSLHLSDSTIEPRCMGGAVNHGVHLAGSSAMLTNLTINADVGVSVRNGSIGSNTVRLHEIKAFAGDYAVWCQDTDLTVSIDHSWLAGGVAAVYNHLDECDVKIGASRLAGGVAGFATCAGVYDSGYTFFASTCPPP